MKLARLLQPANPLFWIMIVLNGLSSILGWMLHTRPLNALGLAIVGSFALANALVGMWIAWRLMREPQPPACK
jgi:hypothetical protein